MAWYNTGNIALTNGSATVTGSGTNFLVGAQIGEALYAPDGKLYEIQTIDSATVITLASTYLGSTASAQGYQIIPTQSLVADLASDVTDLISDFANVRDYAGNGKFNDGAVGTPGITFTQDQDNGLYRIGSNNWALAAGGQKIVDISTSGIDVTGSVTADTGEITRLGLGVAAHASAALNITTTDQHIRLNNGSELGIIDLDSDGELNIWAHGDGETINLRTGSGAGNNVLSVVGNNVGIGNSSPSGVSGDGNNLVIGSASGDNGLSIISGTSNSGSIYFGDTQETGSQSRRGQLVYNHSDDSMRVFTASTERLRIASDGSISTPTAGTNNVRFGANAGNSIASGGVSNVLLGDEAGTAILTGSYNVIAGHRAGDALDTGSNNVALGWAALTLDTKGDKSTAVGRSALASQNFTSSTDSYNVAVGYLSGSSLQKGVQNTLLGALAGDALTSPLANGDSSYNTAVGYSALSSDTLGARSTAFGHEALATQNFTSSTVSANTALGFQAGRLVSTGTYNTLVGHEAGTKINTGASNIVVGGLAGDAITTGNSNVAVGVNALGNNQTGSNSVAVGGGALFTQTGSGNRFNVGVGADAGYTIDSGIQNTLIGSQAGDTITSGAGNVCIGHGADTAAGNSAYSITIGRDVTSIGDYYFTFGVDSSVHRVYNQFTSNASWTRVSDERVKKDVLTNTDCGLGFINDLRTVTYKFKAPSELDPSLTGYDASETEPLYKEKMYGFVAQEVKAAMDAHNITDFAGHNQIEDGADNMQGISYEMFVMPLVKAVQELSAQNEALTARIAALEE